MNQSKLKTLIYILFLIFPIKGFADEPENIQAELDAILKARLFDESLIEGKARSLVFEGNEFLLNKKGMFYKKDSAGNKFPLEIYYDIASKPKKVYWIFDPQKPPSAELPENPLSTKSATPEQVNIIDDIVSVQRLYGIYSMKSKHPDCYYAYAKERIKKNPMERILALERADLPRPLVFETDSDWQDFQEDLKSIFKVFEDPNAYIVILGTSTTFFSENPRKGKNAPLFESPPECIARAQDPELSLDVYTFDTPKAELSDLDIHLFIPKLSNLCNKASVGGNNGVRDVYNENTLDKCFRLSSDEEIKDQVTLVKGTSNTLKKAAVPDKPIGLFLAKWANILPHREINFSVHIRPDQLNGPLKKPTKNFNAQWYLKTRFVIPVQ